PPRWNWCARATWRCTSNRRSRRSTCASASGHRSRSHRPARPCRARRNKSFRESRKDMSALAERRIIPHDELKARSQEKSEAHTPPEHLRLLEALLFAAATPLDEKTLGARLPEDVDLKASLRALQAEYAQRGVNLVRIGNKWTFRTAVDLSWLL